MSHRWTCTKPETSIKTALRKTSPLAAPLETRAVSITVTDALGPDAVLCVCVAASAMADPPWGLSPLAGEHARPDGTKASARPDGCGVSGAEGASGRAGLVPWPCDSPLDDERPPARRADRGSLSASAVPGSRYHRPTGARRGRDGSSEGHASTARGGRG